MGLCDPWDDADLHNHKIEKLGIIALKPINELMERGKTQKKPAPLSRSSTNLQGKQIHMYDLDLDHWQFSNTSEDKFHDKWMLIQWMKYAQVKNQQMKYWMKNLRDILDQTKQLI